MCRKSETYTKIGAGVASFALPWIPAQPAQQMVTPSPTRHTSPRTATCMRGSQWGTCFFWKQQCICRERKPLSNISNSVTDVTRKPGGKCLQSVNHHPPPFRAKYPPRNQPSRTRKRRQPILGRRWFLRRVMSINARIPLAIPASTSLSRLMLRTWLSTNSSAPYPRHESFT